MYDTSIERSEDIFLLPVSGQLAESSIEFCIVGETSAYIDLGRTYLSMLLKVTKADGLAIEKDVKLIEMYPHAMFSQLDVWLNGTQVTQTTGTYGYRAFLTSLLSYSEEVKNEQMDALSGFKGATLTPTKNQIDVYTPLYIDLAHQNKLILNSVEIKIRLTRNNDSFPLLRTDASDAEKYKIQILKIGLFVAKIIPSADILILHSKLLSAQNAHYSIERTVVRAFSIAAGIQQLAQPNIFLGLLPSILILGMVAGASFHGSTEKNPFRFSHYDLTSIHLVVNGRQIPGTALMTDFTQKQCRRAYHQLLETVLRSSYDTISLGISYDDFIDKYPLLAFSIQPLLAIASNECILPPLEGTISAHLTFSKPLPETVSLVVLAQFPASIEIDAARSIYLITGF
jgi:hypothetical protein